MDKKQKAWLAFGILFSLTIIAIGLNSGFETNFGTIKVSEVTITTADGLSQTGKLYLPVGVNESNPAPGVLAIHGYNNDKHVQRPHSLELAKRGVVVLAVDCIDHGDSDNGMYIWSTIPYDAYTWLESQSYVTNETGVVGHSMGAGWARAIAAANPQIDVVGYQAFGTERLGQFNSGLNTTYAEFFANSSTNWIQISSGMEEFGGRDYDESPAEWKAYCEEQIALNTQITGVDDGTGEFFKTYGDVNAGNAQRYVWSWKTHPGQTHDLTSTKEITSFFLQTFGMGTTPDEIKTTYIYAEVLGSFSALLLILSIVPLLSLLLGTSTFSEVKQPMPEMKDSLRTKKWVWWAFATLNFCIGGAVFFWAVDAPDGGLFLQNAFADSGLSSFSEFVADRPFFFQNWIIDANNIAEWTTIESTGKVIYNLGVANGHLSFYSVNAIINLLFVLGWYFIFGKKNRAKGDDLGIYSPSESFGTNARIFGKTVALAAVIFLYMYGLTIFSEQIFHLEIRGPWSIFKTFTNERAAKFWLYLPGVLGFFILNGGIWLFGLMRQPEYGGEFKTSIIWWLKVVFAMSTGLILLNIIGYAPMWFGTGGPFFQNPVFGDGFAPMYLLQSWQMIPLGAAFYWVGVKYYRKTGRIWLGAILLAVLVTWTIVTGTVVHEFVL